MSTETVTTPKVSFGPSTIIGLAAAAAQYAAAVAAFLSSDQDTAAVGVLSTATVTLITVLAGRFSQANKAITASTTATPPADPDLIAQVVVDTLADRQQTAASIESKSPGIEVKSVTPDTTYGERFEYQEPSEPTGSGRNLTPPLPSTVTPDISGSGEPDVIYPEGTEGIDPDYDGRDGTIETRRMLERRDLGEVAGLCSHE